MDLRLVGRAAAAAIDLGGRIQITEIEHSRRREGFSDLNSPL
jgi:hypothetical protein